MSQNYIMSFRLTSVHINVKLSNIKTHFKALVLLLKTREGPPQSHDLNPIQYLWGHMEIEKAKHLAVQPNHGANERRVLVHFHVNSDAVCL